jgi:hypothetical protein
LNERLLGNFNKIRSFDEPRGEASISKFKDIFKEKI